MFDFGKDISIEKPGGQSGFRQGLRGVAERLSTCSQSDRVTALKGCRGIQCIQEPQQSGNIHRRLFDS